MQSAVEAKAKLSISVDVAVAVATSHGQSRVKGNRATRHVAACYCLIAAKIKLAIGRSSTSAPPPTPNDKSLNCTASA